jgi:hypothetical protein
MTAPRRRWSFSLRTLFVLVAAFACWLGYSMNWIRERHAALAQDGVRHALQWRGSTGPMPLSLTILGESTVPVISLGTAELHGQKERMRQLFPEATVLCYIYTPETDRP